ncbi:MAG TPA: hypothetical protein VD994_11940, partial [Prosthecobacter sp.]|nr:hypothetical protein [Prosthecobacter sp.]
MSTRPFKATAAFILLVAALFIASPRLPAAPEAPGAKEGKGSKAALQSYTGALKTGVMAIGAETTGYTLTTAADGVYELDFKNPKLKAQA